MTEGAQVDIGAHANQLSYATTEVIDFDEVVGRALKFADQNGWKVKITDLGIRALFNKKGP